MQSDEQAIDFIFRFRFPPRGKRYHSLRYILFGPDSKSWQRSFRLAYSRVNYGDKNLERSISNQLRKLLVEGGRLWLRETWSLKGIPKNTIKTLSRRTEMNAFEQEARIKRNQPDPRIAMWVFRRRLQLLTAVPALRERLKDRASLMEPVELRFEIMKVLPFKLFLVGLRKIAPEPNPTAQTFFTANWVSTKPMVESMLTAELEAKGYDLKRISLKTYLKEGKKLVTALSLLPK